MRMKQLSFWASRHPHSARISIILAKFLLVPAGLLLGILLFAKSGALSTPTLLLLSTLLGLCWLFYPVKGGSLPHSFVRQKGFDLSVAALAFCLAILGGNRYGEFVWQEGTAASTVSQQHALRASLENGGAVSWKQKVQEKSFRKKIRAQVRSEIRLWRSSKLSSTQILLIVLTILAAIGLLYLVAALACGIACNGSDALAVLAAIGGAGIVIFLAFFAIRGIVRSGGKSG